MSPTTLRLLGPRRLEFVPADLPPVGPAQVRFSALRSGLSHGTELAFYRGASPFEELTFDEGLRSFRPIEDGDPPLYPLPLGYEMVGRVEEVGDAVEELAVGDLIHVGAPHGEAGVADFVPDSEDEFQPIKIGAEEIDAALFLSLAGVAVQATHDSRVKLGDDIAVFGLGTVGLLTVQLLRAAGAGRVIAVDPVAARRELALELGAHDAVDPSDGRGGITCKRTAGRGLDVAIDVSGSYAALQDAIGSVAPRGRVVSASFYSGNGNALALGREWHHNAVEMVASQGGWECLHPDHPRWTPRRVKQTALKLLRDGTLAVDRIPVQVVPYAEAPRAYESLDEQHGELVKLALGYETDAPAAGD